MVVRVRYGCCCCTGVSVVCGVLFYFDRGGDMARHEEVDYILGGEDRVVLSECVTMLREAGLGEVADRIEAVINNLVEL